MSDVRARIVGVGTLPVAPHEGVGWKDLAWQAIALAIRDAGVPLPSVDGLFMPDIGWFREPMKFVTQQMAAELNLSPRIALDVEQGGMSSLIGVRMAADAIAAGRCRVALVAAVEKDIGKRELDLTLHWPIVARGNAFYGAYQSPYGMNAVIALYAMGAQSYMHRYSIAPEQIAELPVQLRRRAADNPIAMQRAPITVEDVLASRMVSPPCHLLEACPWGNGAAAIVLCHPDVARDLGKADIIWNGWGEAHDPSHFMPSTYLPDEIPSARRAMLDALADGGVGVADIDVMCVYGAFAATELILYEEMGLARRGEAPRDLADGRLDIGGDIAVNPAGGLIARGHPPYVTPLLEVAEVTRQLRGTATRQVPDATVAAVHAEHGMVNGNGVGIVVRET